MTEEQKGSLAAEEGAAQEEVVPVKAEEGTSAEGRKTGWALTVAVIAAILALCTIVACVAAAIAVFSGDGDEASAFTPVPAPTAAPVPTRAPGQAMIAITEPDQGQVLDISQPVKVQGKGVGLTEGNVVVEALDWQGTVLDRQPATLPPGLPRLCGAHGRCHLSCPPHAVASGQRRVRIECLENALSQKKTR